MHEPKKFLMLNKTKIVKALQEYLLMKLYILGKNLLLKGIKEQRNDFEQLKNI